MSESLRTLRKIYGNSYKEEMNNLKKNAFRPIRNMLKELRDNDIRFASGCWNFELPPVRNDIYGYAFEVGCYLSVSIVTDIDKDGNIKFKTKMIKNGKESTRFLHKDEVISLISELVGTYGRHNAKRKQFPYEKEFGVYNKILKKFQAFQKITDTLLAFFIQICFLLFVIFIIAIILWNK